MPTPRFTKFLEQIQTSNLDFQLTLSPFSAAISLKKSFIKDKYGNILLPSLTNKVISQQEFNLQHDNAELVDKNEKLDRQNLQLQRTNEFQLQNIKILEKKIVDIEASAFKSFREKSDEVTVLKNTLQSSDQEMTKLKNELQIKNKLIKVKEKEFLKLDQNRGILEATAKKCKEELKTLKSDYKKLQKKDKITSEKSSPENGAEDKLSKIKTPTLTDSSSSHFEKTTWLQLDFFQLVHLLLHLHQVSQYQVQLQVLLLLQLVLKFHPHLKQNQTLAHEYLQFLLPTETLVDINLSVLYASPSHPHPQSVQY